MTWFEFDYRSRAYNRSIERMWEQTRFLGSITINSNAFKKGKKIKPQDLVPLELDKRRNKRPLMTKEQFLELQEKWN